MHQEMMRETRAMMGAPWYVVLSYGEIFTIDNQSWLSVHCYVVQN
jgi:hypothetical protein